jgi:hypothetical protein
MANIIFPQSPFLDPSGRPNREWVQWLQNPNVQTLTAVTFNVDNVILTLPLEVIYGGTGLTDVPTNGQLLIGNGVDYTLNTLTAGTGLTITNGAGSITPRITNTGVVAGAYGSASSVTTLTVNAQGQLTVVGTVAIAIAASQITSGTIASAQISGSYTGITGVGTLTVGTWTATAIGAAYGGTGLTSYTIGDIIYASGTTSLATLPDVATGNALISGGVGVAPSYGKIGLTTHVSGVLPVVNGGTNLASYTIGDIIYASGTTALSKLADVATGNALLSGGIGVAPSYGKVGLATHISGTLLVSNGGTGITSLTLNRIPYGNGTGAFGSSANLTYDGAIFTAKANIVVNKTITAAGTTGAQTINFTAGSVNFAAAATSLVVTNSLVATTSVIMATVATNDTTMKSVQAVAAAGSFTLYASAAATAETRVNFLVLN